MARFYAASRTAASVKSLREKSNLASAPCADAVLATQVASLDVSPSMVAVDPTVSVSGLVGSADPADLVIQDETTPDITKEEVAEPLPVSAPVTAEAVVPLPAGLAAPHVGLEALKEVKNYASLLKASSQLEELGTPTEHVSGVPFVLIPDENITAAKEEFKEFIYARFHGDWPSMGRIIGVVNAIWAKAGPRIFVHNVGEGEFLLRVTNVKTRESLLARTCWNIAGFPMFVAPWSPEFTPEEAPLTSAVVPVELRDVPYLLFNQESLSRLATAVGKPESVAPETERKLNFKVAKLYVRVDLTKPLPTKIISGFSNGKETEISVSYPWLPMKCDLCKKFGHHHSKCRTKIPGPSSRRRSASPAGTSPRTRNKSRPSRAKKSGKEPPPRNEALRVDVEEGEICEAAEVTLGNQVVASGSQLISNSGQLPSSGELSSGEAGVVAACNQAPYADSGVEAVSEKDDRVKPLSDTHPNHQAGAHVDSSVQTSRAPDDSFFLVHGRKSGRKASTSI